jgi:hypothetical protein
MKSQVRAQVRSGLIVPEKPAGPLLPVVPRRGGTAARPAVAWQPDPSLYPSVNCLTS